MKFLCAWLTVLILYFLNKRYNYKSRFIKSFGLISYESAILIPYLLYSFIHIFILNNGNKYVFADPITPSIQSAFFYLMYIPKDLH
jgi:hypothetical protein